jgi:hypothetical protein
MQRPQGLFRSQPFLIWRHLEQALGTGVDFDFFLLFDFSVIVLISSCSIDEFWGEKILRFFACRGIIEMARVMNCTDPFRFRILSFLEFCYLIIIYYKNFCEFFSIIM